MFILLITIAIMLLTAFLIYVLYVLEKALKMESEFKKLKSSIESQKQDINNVKEELRHTDLNVFLLQNYTKQIEINNNLNSDILNIKYEYIINIYKLLLYRKISNQILEYLFAEPNKEKYFKTDDLFEDENSKGKKFPIIIARINIKNIPKNKINLIIDFLMFMKEKCSSIIHFSDNSSIFQLDLLTQLLGGPISNDTSTEKSYLNINQTLSLLFDNLYETQQNNINNTIFIYNQGNDMFKRIKEELVIIKDKIIKEDKKDIIHDLSNKENGSEDSNGSTSQNNNGNDIFNEIKNILYPNSTQKEIIINKINKSMKILSDIEITQTNCEKLNINLTEENSRKNYDIKFLFEEWRKAFNKGYRTNPIYRKLVKWENDTSLQSIKENLSKLAPDLKVELFIKDYHNFSKIISRVITDNEINNYNS